MNSPPGPELDHAVATKVMGWVACRRISGWVLPGQEDEIVKTIRYSTHGNWAFQPSTNIAHAWEVVEKLRDSGFPVSVFATRGLVYEALVTVDKIDRQGLGETAALAICRAAIEALS